MEKQSSNLSLHVQTLQSAGARVQVCACCGTICCVRSPIYKMLSISSPLVTPSLPDIHTKGCSHIHALIQFWMQTPRVNVFKLALRLVPLDRKTETTNYKTAKLSVSTLSLREENSPRATFAERIPQPHCVAHTRNLSLTSLEQTRT